VATAAAIRLVTPSMHRRPHARPSCIGALSISSARCVRSAFRAIHHAMTDRGYARATTASAVPPRAREPITLPHVFVTRPLAILPSKRPLYYWQNPQPRGGVGVEQTSDSAGGGASIGSVRKSGERQPAAPWPRHDHRAAIRRVQRAGGGMISVVSAIAATSCNRVAER